MARVLGLLMFVLPFVVAAQGQIAGVNQTPRWQLW
jgi:hypothetical protein